MRRLLIIALLAICLSQPLFARVEWTAAATGAIIGKPAVAADRASGRGKHKPSGYGVEIRRAIDEVV